MRNPFKRAPDEAKSHSDIFAEAKSFDVLPEGLWQQLVTATDWGASIGVEQAVGVPALLAVIRLLSHAAALVPYAVVRDGNIRERAMETWQWQLLNKRPGPPPATPFNFKADLAANIAGRGNAYVRKIKPTNPQRRLPTRTTPAQTPRVTELQAMYAASVKPKRADNGSIVFEDSTGSVPIERGTDEIIQMRSFSLDKDGLQGVSPISATRAFVSAGLKRNQFDERHLTNGISPSLAINFPRTMTETQASAWLDFIESRHKGSAKAGKAIGVPDGATITQLPISLADALFADMTRLTMEQACAMYQIPFAILTKSTRNVVTDDDYRLFTTWALGPLVTAMAQAFQADDDLFAPGEDDEFSVIPDTDELLKLDALKKAQVNQAMIQSGQRLVDEVRAEDGLGPLPPIPKDWTQHPGQVPQITPVGGAPNPEVDTSQTDPHQQDVNDGAEV